MESPYFRGEWQAFPASCRIVPLCQILGILHETSRFRSTLYRHDVGYHHFGNFGHSCIVALGIADGAEHLASDRTGVSGCSLEGRGCGMDGLAFVFAGGPGVHLFCPVHRGEWSDPRQKMGGHSSPQARWPTGRLDHRVGSIFSRLFCFGVNLRTGVPDGVVRSASKDPSRLDRRHSSGFNKLIFNPDNFFTHRISQ